MVFDRWTVTGDRETIKPGKYKLVIYRCRCSCGSEGLVQQSNLLSGGSKSCGCLHAERASARMRKERGVASANQVLRYYLTNASRRGLEWKLSRTRFMELIAGECFYCGAMNSMIAIKQKDRLEHNGIDRKNSQLGYTFSNCVSCCKTCNNAKGSMGVAEFSTWIARVYVVTQKRFTA